LGRVIRQRPDPAPRSGHDAWLDERDFGYNDLMRGFAIVALFAITSVAGAQPHTVADFQAAMERSNVSYQITSLAPGADRDAVAGLWPEGRALNCPDVRVDSKRTLVECDDVASAAKVALAEGERLFAAKDWEAARKRYEEAKRLSPTSWFLDLYVGDCLLSAGRFEEALRAYDRVIAAKPLHFRGYLFRADALIKLHRFDEAREALITTLTLRPRNPTAMSIALGERAHLGIVPYNERFIARAAVHRFDATHVRVETVQAPQWMAFAICEAYWIGEVRRSSAGWSVDQEHDCFANLVALYQAKKGEVLPEAQLDRLSEIGFHHMLDLFVVYEIGSRIMPDLPLRLDDAARTKLRSYVAQYVLPRANHQ
jgi:tetratricopeptide (TPR) repeat protein